MATPSDSRPGQTTDHIVELADSVADIADRLHERILKEIASYPDQAMPDAQKAVLRTLMDNELMLRQHAQALYADATNHVIQGLDQPTTSPDGTHGGGSRTNPPDRCHR